MIDDPHQVRAVLAVNLRRQRIARQLSLSELARATSMSKATLSGIENGRANPTVETLAALAGALRVPVGELLDGTPAGEIVIDRAASATFARRDGLRARRVGAGVPGTGPEIAEIALEPREERELPARAPGSRLGVFVLDGVLIAGPVERSSELGPGDFMSFPADVPHGFMAGRRAARALLHATAGP